MAIPDYDEQPILYDPNFKGPKNSRVCTDVFFLGFFIVFMIGWAGVGIYALSLNPENAPPPSIHFSGPNFQFQRSYDESGDNPFPPGQDVPTEIANMWWKILMLLLLAVVLCFLYMISLKFFPRAAAWTSIVGVLLLMTAGIIACFVIYNSRGNEAIALLILGIVLCVMLLVIVILLICARKQIEVSIAIIQVGARSVLSIKSTIFFPLVLILMHAAAATFAVTVLERLNTLQSGLGANFCKGYSAFAYIWTYFYISALGEMILAITFGTWYWTFNKNDVPYFTLTNSVLKTYRYHLGTVAYGSFILTIVRILKGAMKGLGSGNNCLFCLCKCFFDYLENLIKFINRNAYIMCGIHGTNFCTSAKNVFSLIMRNAGQFVVANQVTGLLFFFCQLVIILILGGLSYATFMHNAPVLVFAPIIIVVFGTIVITSQFFGVCDIATNTITVCFLEDRERNDGSAERPYYMSNELLHILEIKNDTSDRNNVPEYERVLQ